jgi:hypothetical protein
MIPIKLIKADEYNVDIACSECEEFYSVVWLTDNQQPVAGEYEVLCPKCHKLIGFGVSLEYTQ